LVDEHHIVPDTGFPNNLTDLFGLEVTEFDPLPPGDENHLTFKGAFPTSHLHPAKIWCDIIEPKECQILATYSKDFYAGRPAITMNKFGDGNAIYIGTMSHQYFYYDLIAWLRQLCNLFPLIKAPDTVEVSMREKEDMKIFFLLNHQNSPVRLQFYKPVHDFLSGHDLSGNYDLPPHGVLVLDEKAKHPEPPAPKSEATEGGGEEKAESEMQQVSAAEGEALAGVGETD
jgi:beta-galactosidase